MLLTPAALWLVEKRAPSGRPAILALKSPGWTARFRWRRKKRSGALHAVHDHTDNRRDDRAGHAAADQLADKRADVHAAGGPLQHRDERGQERPAGRAAQSASDCVAGGSEGRIPCRRADRASADRASNELAGEGENPGRRGDSSSVGGKPPARRGNTL